MKISEEWLEPVDDEQNGVVWGFRGFLAPMAVGSMPEEKRPANCISCQSCEQVCPQQIKISDMMKDFSSMIGM